MRKDNEILSRFLEAIRRNSISRDRLFRLGSMEFIQGKSDDEVIRTFEYFGLSNSEAIERLDKIKKISSEMKIGFVER
jgi:hypothetical protein